MKWPKSEVRSDEWQHLEDGFVTNSHFAIRGSVPDGQSISKTDPKNYNTIKLLEFKRPKNKLTLEITEHTSSLELGDMLYYATDVDTYYRSLHVDEVLLQFPNAEFYAEEPGAYKPIYPMIAAYDGETVVAYVMPYVLVKKPETSNLALELKEFIAELDREIAKSK